MGVDGGSFRGWGGAVTNYIYRPWYSGRVQEGDLARWQRVGTPLALRVQFQWCEERIRWPSPS